MRQGEPGTFGNGTLALQCVLFGRLLYFFAVYTVMIKYAFPITWAVMNQVPFRTYIFFWDAWWILHLAVGFGLDRRKKGVWIGAFLLAAAEVLIISVKFFYYLRNPLINFWYLNWFVNKTLLLAYFVVLLLWLFRKETKSLLRK